jgi:hypothetical protein
MIKSLIMFRKFVFAALLFTMFTGCKSGSKSAFNYSEDIVRKEKSLAPDMESTELKVEKYITAEHYDSIAIAGEYMEKLVQKKIDEIDAMPVPKVKESGNFKKATMDYFKYIKKIYTEYKNLGNAKTEDDRAAVIENLRKLVESKQAAINEMQTVQKRYASANGFKIQ